MGRVLLLLLIVGIFFSIFTAPWIAGIAYVVNSLIQPQYLWGWVFSGIPIYKITAGLAILAFIFLAGRQKDIFNIYKDKQNFIILSIWILMHLSHVFSSFKGAPASVSPDIVLDTINSILIMYFILIGLLQNEKATQWLCTAFVLTGLYYAYWANSAYLNQEWYRFQNDRLVGPILSPYSDGNVLSTLLVMCLPFLLLGVFRVKSNLIKVLLIISIPFIWHALVLFGSRAALLSSVVILIPLAYIIKSKKINFVIGLSFSIFLVYQGSLIVNRTSETIESASAQGEEPINPRLVSWEAALRLIPEYPIFGAGVQMFEAASRAHFPGMTPHVAHNTFLNFSANTGIITGILFLSLIFTAYKRLLLFRKHNLGLENIYAYALAASSISLLSFFVSSMFLDLIIFEPFYIVLIINIISSHKIKKFAERVPN